MTVQPFQIAIPDAVLTDLHQRLTRTRWPDALAPTTWDYGPSLHALKDLTSYWRDQFDWRAQETALNQFAQYRATVDGVGLHFIHERGRGPAPRTLLLLHGWPDSFYRFTKLIPLLTDPARFGGDPACSFNVIVPSLPGFGFSDRPMAAGSLDTAGLLGTLMTELLGYDRFGVHGGDTGSPLAKAMARRFPGAVTGLHLTDIGCDATLFLDPADLAPDEQAYVRQVEQWSQAHGAYAMLHATKPQMLAYGLHDSPVGLASWMLEHFYRWSDWSATGTSPFRYDDMLSNIMIYWVTETLNASIHWYALAMGGWDAPAPPPVAVPVAVALAPHDIPGCPPPRALAARLLNIQRWTHLERGGHFAALEVPDLLADDLRAFFAARR